MEGDDRCWGLWHEHRGTIRKITLQAHTALTRLSWLKDLQDLQQRNRIPIWSEFAVNKTQLDSAQAPMKTCRRFEYIDVYQNTCL